MARKQARFGQPAVYNATPPTLTDGDDSALNVDSSGRLITSSVSGSGGGASSASEPGVAVPVTTASTTLLAANTSRRMALISNDSGQILYVKLGSSASSVSYAAKLLDQESAVIYGAYYTGIITGILASGSGSAVVTEV